MKSATPEEIGDEIEVRPPPPPRSRMSSSTATTGRSMSKPIRAGSSSTTSVAKAIKTGRNRRSPSKSGDSRASRGLEDSGFQRWSIKEEKAGGETGDASASRSERTTRDSSRAGLSVSMSASQSAHGPREESADPLLLDDLFPSSSSPSSSSSPKPRPLKYMGAPYVEIPLLPLNRIRQYSKPSNCRHPTALSRNEQIQFNQTPPPSPPEDLDLTFVNILSGLPTEASRKARKRRLPTSASESSVDLGGYGSATSSSDESADSEDSDLPNIRATRSRMKGREPIPKRSTRMNGRPPHLFRHIDGVDSSRSSSSREVHSMPTRSHQYHHRDKSRAKRKRGTESSTSDACGEPQSDYGFGEDELDSANDYSNTRRIKAEGSGKTFMNEVTDDTLYQHRSFCEKCGLIPADDLLEKARARLKKPGQKRKKDPDGTSEEETAKDLGGWLECQRCVVAMHWRCLGERQKKEVIQRLQDEAGPVEFGRPKIRGLDVDEQTTFLCARCDLPDSKCFVCHSDELPSANRDSQLPPLENGKGSEPVEENTEEAVNGADDKAEEEDVMSKVESMLVDVDVEPEQDEGDVKADKEEKPLRFRCVRCKQEAHYEHLDNPFIGEEDASLADIADHYQRPTERRGDGWQCHQCRAWVWTVDMVIAWRPLPAGAKEELDPDEPLNYKSPLPREYLVKWTNRGFRHATWVPHAWLLACSPARLKNFLIKGPSLDLVTDETLAARGDDMAAPTIANIMDEADGANKSSHHRAGDQKDAWKGSGPPPDVDAENSIPAAWKTVDRVLDVMLLPAPKRKIVKGKQRRSRSSSVFEADRDASKIYMDGIEPPKTEQMDIDSWEQATGRDLGPEDVDQVAKLVSWCYLKWDDLQYEQSTWDTPPPKDSPLYPAFHRALGRYLAARNVKIPILSRQECEKREAKAAKFSKPPDKQPECVAGGTLMPFQINGFQWLLTKHFKRESCILADDMGLGKTIQIASLLGYLGSSAHNIYPFLVIVPNSTITNWVREFEKWVPHMRVVPYYGVRASRKVVSKYELYHKGALGKAAGLKAHVVLTTYDTITSSDFSVFKSVPRWEMMIVDEGQRLKSDSNLIFNRLKALNSVHRILLTGTPLNNNLRELFNLLNFLDPISFQYLEDLEEKYKDLNETLLAELHAMIQPYILRRIKADVLRLPPKVEIIVPISLTPIQKHVYRGVLEKNSELIQAILAQRKKKGKVAISGGGPKMEKKLTEDQKQETVDEAMDVEEEANHTAATASVPVEEKANHTAATASVPSESSAADEAEVI